jgi:anthranilate phosphoribosyltransferase
MIKQAIAAASASREVPADTMEGAMETLLRGEATPAQIAALLIALRMKGESAAELAACARVMRRHCVAVELSGRDVLLDTCGTGGDGSDTFNISTAAALVIAAAGVPVAKHGNRSASSKTGSADVLEALGVQIELAPAAIAKSIEDCGIGFMFARLHHPAMRHVAGVRSEIAVRTLFNMIGPLSNPARASHQVLGVPDARLCETLARVLVELGSKRAWVVCGQGGLDELSLAGPSHVVEVDGGNVRAFEVSPADFGLQAQPDADLRVADAAESAAVIRAILAGTRGAPRDVVVLNAAAGLYVAGHAATLPEAAAKAAQAIDSQAAARTLAAWVLHSQQARASAT